MEKLEQLRVNKLDLHPLICSIHVTKRLDYKRQSIEEKSLTIKEAVLLQKLINQYLLRFLSLFWFSFVSDIDSKMMKLEIRKA